MNDTEYNNMMTSLPKEIQDMINGKLIVDEVRSLYKKYKDVYIDEEVLSLLGMEEILNKLPTTFYDLPPEMQIEIYNKLPTKELYKLYKNKLIDKNTLSLVKLARFLKTIEYDLTKVRDYEIEEYGEVLDKMYNEKIAGNIEKVKHMLMIFYEIIDDKIFEAVNLAIKYNNIYMLRYIEKTFPDREKYDDQRIIEAFIKGGKLFKDNRVELMKYLIQNKIIKIKHIYEEDFFRLDKQTQQYLKSQGYEYEEYSDEEEEEESDPEDSDQDYYDRIIV